MSGSADAVVIGADAAGLAAAALLARAGVSVVVLEAAGATGGAGAALVPVANHMVAASAPTLHALDPHVVRALKLRGLRFAARDLSLVALRQDGRPLAIGRDRHDTAHAIALVSPPDAERYGNFRRDLFAFARAMRARWWEEGAPALRPVQSELRRLRITSATALLDAAFVSDALKAAFAFDVLEGGLSPSAAGSSLVLAWQAAQEMCGLQGAVAMPLGGRPALTAMLEDAAHEAGADIRAGSPVEQVVTEDDAVCGVRLRSGESVAARVVLSTLPRRRTLLDLLPTGAIGFAAARRLAPARHVGDAVLVFALEAVPGFAALHPASRFVMAEQLEACVTAYADARGGRLPANLALEAVVSADPELAPGLTLLVVTARPVPVSPPQGWPALMPALVERVASVLEHHAPGIRGTISGLNAVPPHAGRDPLDPAHIAADWRTRIATPVEGLLLCGDSAEPVPALSCRAARLAAGMAADRLKRRPA
jgi:phytoene dehydrogenase-like protein